VRDTIPPEQILTGSSIDDFCAMSGLSETQVWKMIKRRAVDSYLVGKHRRLIVIESYSLISEQVGAVARGVEFDAAVSGRVRRVGHAAVSIGLSVSFRPSVCQPSNCACDLTRGKQSSEQHGSRWQCRMGLDAALELFMEPFDAVDGARSPVG
jgi:hypothetical protein